jgi:hypothetical protein
MWLDKYGLGLMKRQANKKARSFSFFAFQSNGSFVLFYDLLADRESHPKT